jgi:NAD(P)-dependent dehydrogenase (short-subunit alcohol dehydrogenase family)
MELNGNLQGHVVLVTGAGSGLGEATARAFAQAGAHVACLDVNGQNARRVSEELERPEASCLALSCDVSNADQVQQAVQQVIDRFGRLDVVVNNAAIDHTVGIDEMSIEQWDQVIGVNLRGPFLTAKAALPQMKKQKSGHIVNIASTAALRAWANAAAYHASKMGVVGLGRGLGVEGRPYNVRVTTVYPGGMNTHFFDRFAEQDIPMPDVQNLIDPCRVAEAIVFAVQMPAPAVVQELMITPLTETSWP